MAVLLALLPLLAQIGPYTPAAASPTANIPRVEGRDKPKRRPAPDAPVLPAPSTGKGQACKDAIETSPAEAAELAADWLTSARGGEVADAQACLGLASAKLGEWDDAQKAFGAARDASSDDRTAQARFGAAAGNAAMAGGDLEQALADLSRAGEDAKDSRDNDLIGGIAIDRAIALAGLKRSPEAEASLDKARAFLPQSADAWLLSATLARRQEKLLIAQSQIEKAVELAPMDPAVGLEAGLIAKLSGRDEAARKSWQSVVSTAPGSPEAARAKDYLAQLGPPPAAH